MSILTPRQQQIFSFICNHVQNQGWPPTIREIACAFGIRSPNGVAGHLSALQRKGLIERGPGCRSIRLIGYGVRLAPR
jgi:repressor LexA